MACLPRIGNKPVTIHGAEAHYRRLVTCPQHPDSAYTIPDRDNPLYVIDVILLSEQARKGGCREH